MESNNTQKHIEDLKKRVSNIMVKTEHFRKQSNYLKEIKEEKERMEKEKETNRMMYLEIYKKKCQDLYKNLQAYQKNMFTFHGHFTRLVSKRTINEKLQRFSELKAVVETPREIIDMDCNINWAYTVNKNIKLSKHIYDYVDYNGNKVEKESDNIEKIKMSIVELLIKIEKMIMKYFDEYTNLSIEIEKYNENIRDEELQRVRDQITDDFSDGIIRAIQITFAIIATGSVTTAVVPITGVVGATATTVGATHGIVQPSPDVFSAISEKAVDQAIKETGIEVTEYQRKIMIDVVKTSGLLTFEKGIELSVSKMLKKKLNTQKKKSQTENQKRTNNQPRKSSSRKSQQRKSPSKKSPSKKSPSRKSPSRKSPSKKSQSRKSSSRKNNEPTLNKYNNFNRYQKNHQEWFQRQPKEIQNKLTGFNKP